MKQAINLNGEGLVYDALHCGLCEHLSGHEPITVFDLLTRISEAQEQAKRWNTAVDNMVRIAIEAGIPEELIGK